MPAGDVVIHDVLADEAARYVPHDVVVSGGLEKARDLDLWLSVENGTLVVDRLVDHRVHLYGGSRRPSGRHVE